MDGVTTHERLRPSERWGVLLLLLAFVGFGVVVEVRSAFLERRMGDVGCYLRAAWALRAGENLYDVVDDNIWHYNYPPLYAILMMPLADPPRGADTTGFVPYAVSAGICYALNVFCLIVGVHWLASALESSAGRDPKSLRWSRRWWLLRTTPIVVCLSTIGHTLNRGQTNIVLLMLVCGLIAGLMTGRRFRAGVCLAAAICIKVFPAFLLLVPLWRRDRRCLAGTAYGLLVGLLLIPAAVMGPHKTVTAYRDFARVTLGPALGMSDDKSRAEELIETTATDNQSFSSALQASLHPDRDTRPRRASLAIQAASLGLGAVLTLLTLWAGRGGRARTGPGVALFVGCLAIVMLMLSPVCHSHYFVLEVPLIAGLLALAWNRRPKLTGPFIGVGENSVVHVRLAALFGVLLVGNLLPQFSSLIALRDRGVPALAALLLWFVAWQALARQSAVRSDVVALPDALPRAA